MTAISVDFAGRPCANFLTIPLRHGSVRWRTDAGTDLIETAIIEMALNAWVTNDSKHIQR